MKKKVGDLEHLNNIRPKELKTLHKDRHIETPPEREFKKILSTLDIPYDIYQFFMPKDYDLNFKRNYEMDFAIPELKISFEINGNFHYDTSTWELAEYYADRKQYIESFGWKEIDVHYLICYNRERVTEIIEHALNGEFQCNEEVIKEIKDYYNTEEERKRFRIVDNVHKRKSLYKMLETEKDLNKIDNIKKQIKKLDSGKTSKEEHVYMKKELLEELKKFLINHPNYVSTPDTLDKYLETLFNKKIPLKLVSILKDRITILEEHPEIDYTKVGWGEELGKYFKMPGNSAIRFIRDQLPQFYQDKCFRRKDSKPINKEKVSYDEIQEKFRKERIYSILHSGIDFTKEHWVSKVTEFLGLKARRSTLKWLRKYMPEFCEKYLNYDYNRYPSEDTKKQGVSSWIKDRKQI